MNGNDSNKWSISACKIYMIPAFNIIIREIAIIKIIESACGIITFNQSMHLKNA